MLLPERKPAESYLHTVADNLDSASSVGQVSWSTIEGNHNLTVTATDAAGNAGSVSRT